VVSPPSPTEIADKGQILGLVASELVMVPELSRSSSLAAELESTSKTVDIHTSDLFPGSAVTSNDMYKGVFKTFID